MAIVSELLQRQRRKEGKEKGVRFQVSALHGSPPGGIAEENVSAANALLLLLLLLLHIKRAGGSVMRQPFTVCGLLDRRGWAVLVFGEMLHTSPNRMLPALTHSFTSPCSRTMPRVRGRTVFV